jgi:hypothetical protein
MNASATFQRSERWRTWRQCSPTWTTWTWPAGMQRSTLSISGSSSPSSESMGWSSMWRSASSGHPASNSLANTYLQRGWSRFRRMCRVPQANHGEGAAGVPWEGELSPPVSAWGRQSTEAAYVRGGPKGPTAVVWNGEREVAFTEVKRMLASATRLAHPSQIARLSLAVNASMTHWHLSPAAAGRVARVEASGFLLEARAGPGHVVCLRQGTPGLLLGDSPLPVLAEGQGIHYLYC